MNKKIMEIVIDYDFYLPRMKKYAALSRDHRADLRVSGGSYGRVTLAPPVRPRWAGGHTR